MIKFTAETTVTDLLQQMIEINAAFYTASGETADGTPLYAIICANGVEESKAALDAIEAVKDRLAQKPSEDTPDDVTLSISRNRLTEILEQARHAYTYVSLETEDDVTLGALRETHRMLRLLLADAQAAPEASNG